MKVYVMVDIEGISGIYTKSQVLPEASRFDEGRKYMTGDINACVRGLKAGGADEVIVYDCHGESYSAIWEDLCSEADYYISGHMPDVRFYGIEGADAIVLLGYHAMAGTRGGVLDHSYSSADIQNIWVNGKAVGEIAMDAAIAGEKGIPVIMVSGDDKACSEAESFLPGVTTACVKRGMSTFGAMLLPKEKAHKIIFDKAKEAVENIDKCKLFTFDKPMKAEVEVTERTVISNSYCAPYKKITGCRTFEVCADSAEALLFRATDI